ncbi:hypothetical protein LIA77_01427 [Sarocladium implicatum]|nr:hypothetical protein LIA77_01427 [Sarocladium implicatum]
MDLVSTACLFERQAKASLTAIRSLPNVLSRQLWFLYTCRVRQSSSLANPSENLSPTLPRYFAPSVKVADEGERSLYIYLFHASNPSIEAWDRSSISSSIYQDTLIRPLAWLNGGKFDFSIKLAELDSCYMSTLLATFDIFEHP